MGARFNVNYLELSKGTDIEFYLFEPNPRFFNKLRKRIGKIAHPQGAVKMFNFGFSNEECELVYYKDTQSFAKNHLIMESEISGPKLKIKTISKFCSEHNIDYIDFLKTDVESLDYNVLLGGKNIILNSCKYCQFEFGIGADLKNEKVTPEHYYNYFDGKFTLYLFVDNNHPIYKDIPGLPPLAKLTPELRGILPSYMIQGYGANLLAVRDGVAIPVELARLMGFKGDSSECNLMWRPYPDESKN